MGGIFGLVGEGSLAEARAMGELLAHRGGALHVWSPAPRIHLGVRSAADARAGQNFAADAQIDDGTPDDLVRTLERGIHALQEIHGYFSLAYWDDMRKCVVLACDTSGFKSLYYTVLDGRIAFASEYKAFLALADFRAELDRDAAQYYLATRTFRMDRPMMKGVQSITAGGALTIEDGRITRGAYWLPVSRVARRSKSELARAVRDTLTRVVLRQARGFPRVGITLSGGLDSACVLALLRNARPDLEIASYTIGFGPEDPEILGGQELARLYGTHHREMIFDPRAIPAHLPRLVWLMEDCTGREEALLQHLVLSEAARFERVIFGGYGADMLFAGMPRYRLVRLRELCPWLRKPLAEIFQYTQCGAEPSSLVGRLGRRLLAGRGSFPPPRVAGSSGPARVAEDEGLDRFIAAQMCEAQDSGYLEASLEPHGVEFRDPFQSTEMMDLALTIPGRYNVGVLKQKAILRRALRDLLPPAVRGRGKSLQRVRHDLALSEVLDEMADELLSVDTLNARGLISPAYVRRLRARSANRPYSSEQLYRLWTLLGLETWQRQFIDSRALMAGDGELRLA